ncbi:semaphorin 3F, partial [Chelydra serpentina]
APPAPPELLQTRTVRPFAFGFNTSDFRILLLDQDQDRLYLGARDFLLALDLHNLNKEPLIVRAPDAWVLPRLRAGPRTPGSSPGSGLRVGGLGPGRLGPPPAPG